MLHPKDESLGGAGKINDWIKVGRNEAHMA